MGSDVPVSLGFLRKCSELNESNSNACPLLLYSWLAKNKTKPSLVLNYTVPDVKAIADTVLVTHYITLFDEGGVLEF